MRKRLAAINFRFFCSHEKWLGKKGTFDNSMAWWQKWIINEIRMVLVEPRVWTSLKESFGLGSSSIGSSLEVNCHQNLAHEAHAMKLLPMSVLPMRILTRRLLPKRLFLYEIFATWTYFNNFSRGSHGTFPNTFARRAFTHLRLVQQSNCSGQLS